MPAIVALALGAAGAAILLKLISREWLRVNADLDRMNPARVKDNERAAMPTLRRDPVTGEYRPKG